jgi:6,7-dimethyl-8-ribityllumazine synthase
MIDRMDSAPGTGYLAGACNIGRDEIARRRRSAVLLTAVTALVAVGLVATGLPHVARWAIAPFAAGAAISWLQVVRRFCVAFGALGVRNFGRLGEQVRVEEDEARAADRTRALTMILQGGAIGLGIAALLVILPA